jgi:hypothetical protein
MNHGRSCWASKADDTRLQAAERAAEVVTLSSALGQAEGRVADLDAELAAGQAEHAQLGATLAAATSRVRRTTPP